jgi:mannitol operon transcriptional antiterminator
MSGKGFIDPAAKLEKNKKRKTLSKRQKEIIRILAQMGGNSVTAAAISEKLAVSTRTVLREIPAIEEWLLENDFKFVRKRGKGIAIEETPENLALVEELLQVDKDTVSYSKDDRRSRILGTLFFAVSPLKAYTFTSLYDISEGTLYGDLDILETWLEDYDLIINRRPGLGIFITGEEPKRRQAIINALFEFIDINRIPALFDSLEKEEESELLSHPLIPFFDKTNIAFARQALDYCQESLSVHYVDSSQISLMSRIALAVYRMKHERYLRTMPKEGANLIHSNEYETAAELAELIKENFHINVPEEEIVHLAVYLATSRVWDSSGKMDDPVESIHLRHVVLSMISIAESMTDIPFRNDSQLIDDLAEHVAVMKKRISMDLIIGSSQSAVIKENYPAIYSAAETACQVLTEWIYPKDLKESDIGFIAIHFAAAAERLQKHARKVAVAVVCPVGIASSKMLAASLVRYFPEIEVRRITSAFSINEDMLRREGIELIISTADIYTDFPHLCVNKVLQVQDRMRITNHLSEINRGRIQERLNRREQDTDTLSMESLRSIAGLGTEIVELVEHFQIVTISTADTMEELMEISADVVADSPEMKEKILEGFKEREKISDTYVEGMEICLLHCKVDAVCHSRFKYISLTEPMMTGKGLLKGAVVMIVQKEIEDDILIEPVGRLSALLVEDQRFLQALLSRDQAAGTRYIEKALVKYYQQEVLKIMEV